VTAKTARVFKTAWFAKAAKKARIGDPELCAAIREVQRGQADDLGGAVFKKRLDDNMHRGQRWPELDICVSVREEGPSQHLAR
jgi:hypothetical protein